MTLSGGGAARVSAVLVLLCAAAAGCATGSPARTSGARLPSRPAGTVSRLLPGCTTTAQSGPLLRSAATATTTLFPAPDPAPPGGVVPGPFGVAVTAAGNWGFATAVPIATAVAGVPVPVQSGQTPPAPSPPPASHGNESGVDVLRLTPGQAPALVHTIRVPGPTTGAALSANGRLLLVASGSGAAVISVPAAERGSRAAVLGRLRGPGGVASNTAIEAAITPDGRYAFVSLEDSARIAVFSLARAMAVGFRARAGYVGSIPTGIAPVGIAVSPDGRWLYATSESANGTSQIGTLSVISVARAESEPAKSVVASVPAGCSPVRVITSANGTVVWVTARGSDALLAFSAARLRADAAHALLADVQVGTAPVGLALARAGSLIVVSDSDRFATGLPPGNLAVVDVADALAGRPALLGYLPAGRFPRDVAGSASGGVLLVANFASGQAEAVNAAALP